MEINYNAAREDITSIVRTVSKVIWSRRENAKRKYTLQAINLLSWVPIGVFFAYSFDKSDQLGRWALYGVGLAVMALWTYRLVERKIINQLPADPGSSLGPLKLIADETGITVIATGSKATTAWEAVRDIKDAGDYVLIFIDNHAAHCVPKKAIGDEANVKSFIEKIISLKAQYAN